MSANYNGDINNDYKIIEMLKQAGADAVKLQTYHLDTIIMGMKALEFIIEGSMWRWPKAIRTL